MSEIEKIELIMLINRTSRIQKTYIDNVITL